MSATLSDAPALRGVITSPLLIGGVSTAAEDNRYFTTVEALSAEPIAHVASASVSDARRAVDAAAAARPLWAATSPAERPEVLQRAASLLHDPKDEIGP